MAAPAPDMDLVWSEDEVTALSSAGERAAFALGAHVQMPDATPRDDAPDPSHRLFISDLTYRAQSALSAVQAPPPPPPPVWPPAWGGPPQSSQHAPSRGRADSSGAAAAGQLRVRTAAGAATVMLGMGADRARVKIDKTLAIAMVDAAGGAGAILPERLRRHPPPTTSVAAKSPKRVRFTPPTVKLLGDVSDIDGDDSDDITVHDASSCAAASSDDGGGGGGLLMPTPSPSSRGEFDLRSSLAWLAVQSASVSLKPVAPRKPRADKTQKERDVASERLRASDATTRMTIISEALRQRMLTPGGLPAVMAFLLNGGPPLPRGAAAPTAPLLQSAVDRVQLSPPTTGAAASASAPPPPQTRPAAPCAPPLQGPAASAADRAKPVRAWLQRQQQPRPLPTPAQAPRPRTAPVTVADVCEAALSFPSAAAAAGWGSPFFSAPG